MQSEAKGIDFTELANGRQKGGEGRSVCTQLGPSSLKMFMESVVYICKINFYLKQKPLAFKIMGKLPKFEHKPLHDRNNIVCKTIIYQKS